jgi:hypothetical protein
MGITAAVAEQLCRRQPEESTISCDAPHRRGGRYSAPSPLLAHRPMRGKAEVRIMENGDRHSFRLFAAACLTACGLATVVAGAGISGLPRHARNCGSAVTNACCAETAAAATGTAARSIPVRLVAVTQLDRT